MFQIRLGRPLVRSWHVPARVLASRPSQCTSGRLKPIATHPVGTGRPLSYPDAPDNYLIPLRCRLDRLIEGGPTLDPNITELTALPTPILHIYILDIRSRTWAIVALSGALASYQPVRAASEKHQVVIRAVWGREGVDIAAIE